MNQPNPFDARLIEIFGQAEKVDLTHPLKEEMPVWPGHPCFCHDLVESYEEGAVSKHYRLSLGEHTGTHLDAPLHFIQPPNGWSIDKTPIEYLMGRMLVMRFPEMGGGGCISLAMIQQWEADHAHVQAGDSVFFSFGWDKKWGDSLDTYFHSWPGIDGKAAQYLAARHVRLVGCDCASIDASGSEDFPAHRALLSAGVLIGENFNNLGEVGSIATFVGLPLPIVDGTGSPLRAVAILSPPSQK